MCLNFTFKGRLIQTNSGAREHLLFEVPSGTRKTMGTDAVIRSDWSTFTCVIGPTVKGKKLYFESQKIRVVNRINFLSHKKNKPSCQSNHFSCHKETELSIKPKY